MKLKDTVVIVTASTRGIGLAVTEACAKEMGVIYGMGAFEKGEVKGKAAMTEAYEMGKNS
jgi:NAD(P)-dependent dehydrogenase (short-subunit alcohol dehydrogenase family)